MLLTKMNAALSVGADSETKMLFVTIGSNCWGGEFTVDQISTFKTFSGEDLYEGGCAM